jgi:hypothetical protein
MPRLVDVLYQPSNSFVPQKTPILRSYTTGHHLKANTWKYQNPKPSIPRSCNSGQHQMENIAKSYTLNLLSSKAAPLNTNNKETLKKIPSSPTSKASHSCPNLDKFLKLLFTPNPQTSKLHSGGEKSKDILSDVRRRPLSSHPADFIDLLLCA